MTMTIERPKTGKTTMMRLGAISYRRELSPRGISTEAVETYTVRIRNGEQPKPLVLEPKTNEIVDGRHRYQAFVKVHESNWQDFEVPVIFDSNAPSPEREARKFRVYCANYNRDHGVPLTYQERRHLLRENVEATEPEEYLRSLMRSLALSEDALSRLVAEHTHRVEREKAIEETRKEVKEAAAVKTDGVATTPWADQPTSEPLSRGIAAYKSRPGNLRVLVDRVIAELNGIKGTLTDAEVTALKKLAKVINKRVAV